MANSDIGIDLGTSNVVITMGNKGVVLSEPSVISYNTRTERVLAVGSEAYDMNKKNPDYIAVVRTESVACFTMVSFICCGVGFSHFCPVSIK